jgi:hypothetical protein
MIIETCRFQNGARWLQQMALKANGIAVVLRTRRLIVGDSVMDCFAQALGDGDASPGAV